jgi:glycosyltransferase involved in cell wall biosynthesis
MDAVGGTERVVVNLSAVFKTELDIDVTVITMTGKESLLPLASGVHFYSMQDIPLYKKGFVLQKILKERNINTLISVGMTRLNIWLALMLPLLRGIKVIATEHVNMTLSSFGVKVLKKILFAGFDYFVVLTHSNELLYQKWGFKNVLTIPNSNSFDEVSVRNYKLKSKVILTIGRLVKQKNFMHLLMAWNEVFRKYSDWKLQIQCQHSFTVTVTKNALKKHSLALVAEV